MSDTFACPQTTNLNNMKTNKIRHKSDEHKLMTWKRFFCVVGTVLLKWYKKTSVFVWFVCARPPLGAKGGGLSLLAKGFSLYRTTNYFQGIEIELLKLECEWRSRQNYCLMYGKKRAAPNLRRGRLMRERLIGAAGDQRLVSCTFCCYYSCIFYYFYFYYCWYYPKFYRLFF